MYSIQIIGYGSYLPNKKVENDSLNKKFNLDSDWIYQRSGIRYRYYAEESISELAIKATEKLIENSKIDISEVEAIFVATTTSQRLMPGISFDVQNAFSIKSCICLDILAGCSGYINAVDIARNYIAIGKIKNALVIGVEVLSKFMDMQDINTNILLGDGAGALLIGRCEKEKVYYSKIESDASQKEILSTEYGKNLFMDGKKIYRFAINETVRNIEDLLQENQEKLENIKFVVPHQSNQRILDKITTKLSIEQSKMYSNLENVGNTFCASIPIAVSQMMQEKLLEEGDKIILIGYGGGLNWGSILLEI